MSEGEVWVHNSYPGWIAKTLYSKLGRTQSRLQNAFEKALKKGVARKDNEAGIKMLTGKGVKEGGKLYQYELKLAPGSEYGGHRLLGNLKKVPLKGKGGKTVVHDVIVFSKHMTK